jgi:hypothetical protein
VAKFKRREERWNSAVAFVMTFVEAILALTFVRLVYRLLHKALAGGYRRITA